MKRAIFIDLHGILLDFVTAAFVRYGAPVTHGPYDPPTFGCPECVDIWCDLNEPTFWANLPTLAPGLRMLARVREWAAHHRIAIYLLTRPLEACPLAMAGTVKAALALGFKFEQIIFASDKTAVAPGFLIDDEPDNVLFWSTNGDGGGFIWPALLNCFVGYRVPLNDGSFTWTEAEANLMASLRFYFNTK